MSGFELGKIAYVQRCWPRQGGGFCLMVKIGTNRTYDPVQVTSKVARTEGERVTLKGRSPNYRIDE